MLVLIVMKRRLAETITITQISKWKNYMEIFELTFFYSKKSIIEIIPRPTI